MAILVVVGVAGPEVDEELEASLANGMDPTNSVKEGNFLGENAMEGTVTIIEFVNLQLR